MFIREEGKLLNARRKPFQLVSALNDLPSISLFIWVLSNLWLSFGINVRLSVTHMGRPRVLNWLIDYLNGCGMHELWKDACCADLWITQKSQLMRHFSNTLIFSLSFQPRMKRTGRPRHAEGSWYSCHGCWWCWQCHSACWSVSR